MFVTRLDSLALVALLLCALLRRLYVHRRSPFPPGPTALPFFGNIHQLSLVDSYKTYTKWAHEYGPVVHFHVFGRRFILLNTLEAATDLFEKRSGTYSTKPRLVMAGELVGRAQTSVLFLSYGARLRECRRLVHAWVNRHAMPAAYPAQERGSHRLLGALLDDPARFSDHVRTQAGAVILKLTYGLECDPLHDPHIAMAERLSRITARATQPGRWLCDSFPARS